MDGALKFSSLSDQVYNHLRRQMNRGDLLPGSTINIGEIANQLGISKTPLRDALIHLELEGFVTILPRRGVKVNKLTIEDVQQAYDAIGLAEGFIVRQCIDKFTSAHIQALEALNLQMREDINSEDFTKLFEHNLTFHNIYLDVSSNEMLKKFILPIKHRLYDFPRKNYIKEWELRNCGEHDKFISYLKDGDGKRAASILQDTHWSFEVQKDFIFTFYNESAV
jgi:DNA-binding GntR family transcriptional regulator